eukprot:12096690-Prorocentrum_lima.AAC.1
MFLRCVPTSTFIEKAFAPLTQMTGQPRSRHSLEAVAAAHVNTVFDEAVQRWWATFPDAERKAGLCRPPCAKAFPPGKFLCAWQAYVKSHPPPP